MDGKQQISKRQEYQNMSQQCKNLKTWIHGVLKAQDHSVVKDFLSNMDEKDNDKISDDAENFILEYIESIILNTTKTACRIAHSRNSPVLEKKDMDYAIQMQLVHKRKANASSYLPPEMEEIYSKVKKPKQEHLDNISLLEKFQQNKREQNQ